MSASSRRQTRRKVFSNGSSGFVTLIATPTAGALPADRGAARQARRPTRVMPGPLRWRPAFRRAAPRHAQSVTRVCRWCVGPGMRRLLDRVAASFHARERRALKDAGIVHRPALGRRPAVAFAAIGLGLFRALAIP